MSKCQLKCTRCSAITPFILKGKCDCGGTLLVEYDLEAAARSLTKSSMSARPSTMWRYHELLPVQNLKSIVSLGEGWTPLLPVKLHRKELPSVNLFIKREEQNPAGSFKARGFSAAVSLLNERGIRKVAVPSNGNAASALSAYAARAGMKAYVFMPKDCPGMIVEECRQYGAQTYLVDGMIHDAGKIIEDGKIEQEWFNVGTLKEPGRVEGKKTMGLELAEQLKWKFPDVIIYPTGGGSGIIGLWKAFRELKQLGLVMGDIPRLISVQEVGCQPIVDEFEAPSASMEMSVIPNPTGLRVPKPPDLDFIVSILRNSGGMAIAVTAEEIEAARIAMGLGGVSASPEGAATWAGFMRLWEQGWIRSSETVVLFNTSHAMKYLPWSPAIPVPVITSYAEYKRLAMK